jgi:hypothetical protein
MSRSYRKPIIKDGYGSRWKPRAKRWANKAVRLYPFKITDGGSYKLLYNSWDICDWRFDNRWNTPIEYVIKSRRK